VKPVTPSMKAKAVTQLLLEENNMKLLQRSYLTEDEEHGHVAASGRLSVMHAKIQDDVITKRMYKHYTMEEHLNHLNVTKKWE